ncbi:MAG: acetyltransferase [Bacillota bacterium]|nr:acetyltransferase [Bacillota bacterium]MDW7678747.1 acetyltransferase [Bacillota bacterium]
MKSLYIIGAGGFSKQVVEIVEKMNEQQPQYQIEGMIDDDPHLSGQNILGYPVIGNTQKLVQIASRQPVSAVVAFSVIHTRHMIVSQFNEIDWVNLVHPSAVISRTLTMGRGNIICAGTIINPDCVIHNHCHINIGCTLGHDVTLKNYVTLMPGCHLSGNVSLHQHTTIGTGASILPGLSVGRNTIIGAGAVLTRPAKPHGIYTGLPARRKKHLPDPEE